MSRIENIIEMQDQLNKSTAGENWTSGVADNGRWIDWDLCIFMEFVELLDSCSWKHWKDVNKPHDVENVKMELVDILHFITSKAILEKKTDVLMEELSPPYLKLPDDGTEVAQMIPILMAGIASELKEVLFYFKVVLTLFKFDLEEIYDLYLGKNILNTFRQQNGYANAEYIKIWDGEEDNAYLAKVMEDETDVEVIKQLLTLKYAEVVASDDRGDIKDLAEQGLRK